MSTPFFASFHVLLLFVGAFFYYAALLNLLSRKEVSKRALQWKISLGFLSTLSAWIIGLVFLDGYFIGKLGFITDPNVTSLVPALVFAREIALPLLIVASMMIVFLVFTKGTLINEYPKLKMTLVYLASLSFILAVALTFLGILVP